MLARTLRKVKGLLSTLTIGNEYTYTTRRVVARRVPRYEIPRQTPERIVDEWPEEFVPELDNASDVQRLEEEERYQRPRTTRLPEQHERMGRKYKEIPDPWLDSYK